VQKNGVRGFSMPLARTVNFEAQLEKCSLFQVPKKIRWEFKLEPDQMLKVGVCAPQLLSGYHYFFAKMGKDGRIRVPRLVCAILKGKEPTLAGFLIDISLQPASRFSEKLFY
jgi:hypothetical protein